MRLIHYHWLGRFESGQRSDGAVWMMESVSNVRIVNATHSHHHIAHLTTASTVHASDKYYYCM